MSKVIGWNIYETLYFGISAALYNEIDNFKKHKNCDIHELIKKCFRIASMHSKKQVLMFIKENLPEYKEDIEKYLVIS